MTTLKQSRVLSGYESRFTFHASRGSTAKMLGLVNIMLFSAGIMFGTWQLGQGAWIYTKASLAQYLLRQAWDRTLAGEGRVKPWPWADTWPVGRLSMPRLGIDLIVLDGDSGRTLAFGPGHSPSSAPFGVIGSSIVSAHRDTHFRFLAKVTVGDVFLVQDSSGTVHRYEVTDMSVVGARRARIRHAEDRASLVLITCYPFETIVPGGPLRYVVVAE